MRSDNQSVYWYTIEIMDAVQGALNYRCSDDVYQKLVLIRDTAMDILEEVPNK